MKKSIIFLVFALLFHPFFNASAQEENYDAVYLSLTKEYTLNPDGTIDFRLNKSLKLQNYRSFHRLFGETFVVFHPDFQTLNVNEAYTIMEDGKKVVAPNNAFNEVLPYFASHAPAFNQLREMVITHTGLEIGATIHLDYQVHTARGFYPAFMGSTLFAEDQPVKKLTVIIRTPVGQPVYFHSFNAAVEPVETTENGFRVYTWTISDIPAMDSELREPEDPPLAPSLIFSSEAGFQSLTDFLMSQEAFAYQTNPGMNVFVEDQKAENQKQADLAFALQERVIRDFNLFDIPGEYTGYRLRTPVQVWNSNGGTPAEKAVLLAALLKQAGMETEPVLIFRKGLFESNIGNLTEVEEWAVRTETESTGVMYLSVKQANAFDLTTLHPGSAFMVLGTDNTFEVIYPGQNRATLSMRGVFVLDPEQNLSGELTGTLSGPALPYLALVRSDDKVKYYLRGCLASAKISELSFSELSPNQAAFTCNLTKAESVKKDSNLFILAVPFFSTGIDSWHTGQVPSAIRESSNFTLAIPESLQLASGEQEIRIKNNAGSFLFQVKSKGNTIHVQREIEIEKKATEATDYKAMKELFDNASLWQTNNLIFRK